MKFFSSQSSRTMRAILVEEHNFAAVVMLDSLMTLNPNDSSFLLITWESSSFDKDTWRHDPLSESFP